MRNILSVIVIAIAVVLISSLVASAGVFYDDGHVKLSYSVEPGDEVSSSWVNANISLDNGIIQWGSVSVYPTSNGKGFDATAANAYVSIYFGGPLVAPTKEIDWIGESLSITKPGVSLYESIGKSVYLDDGSGKGFVEDSAGLVAKLWSHAGGYFQGNFEIAGSANGQYYEYWSDWDQLYYWSGSLNVPIILPNGVSASSIPSVSSGSQVPEPALMGLVSSGGIFFFGRRRRKM